MTAAPRTAGNPNDPPRLPPRDPAGHKGTFGTVTVIAGCAGPAPMLGAGALAATAALRAGAGLVRLVMPEPVLAAALTLAPSATGCALPVDAAGRLVPHAATAIARDAAESSHAVVIGPGLGSHAEVAPLVHAVLVAARASTGPRRLGMVLDADGLNALARAPIAATIGGPWLALTPHPGEFARLALAAGTNPDGITATTRPAHARALAEKLGATVILKGADTVVAHPAGTWTSGVSDHALATAGTGDVLAGLLGGLIAQHSTTDLPALARAAVAAHAAAAAAWRARHRASCGLLAMELCEELPAALDALRGP